MAASLILSQARIDDADGATIYPRVQITVRMNKADVRAVGSRDVVIEKLDVTSVARNPGGSKAGWSVSFADGTTWQVARLGGGCGCGR